MPSRSTDKRMRKNAGLSNLVKTGGQAVDYNAIPDIENPICLRCGKQYQTYPSNFKQFYSPLYRGINGYLPICNTCVDIVYNDYLRTYGDEKKAVRRVCEKLDIYWSESIYAESEKSSLTSSRIRAYIAKAKVMKYVGKTYDDTHIEEEREMQAKAGVSSQGTDDIEFVVEREEVNRLKREQATTPVQLADIPMPTDEVVNFWGAGFTPEWYYELEDRYAKWTRELDDLDDETIALYRQICLLEVTINKNSQAGKPVEQSVNALNNILGAANLRPVQKKQSDAGDNVFDSLPFGVGIRIFENTQPIPQPDPRWKDFDGIVRYITVYFLGHLCKMLNIRNTYCRMYEEEMARLRVDRPDLDDEDDEGAFNDIFGGEPAVIEGDTNDNGFSDESSDNMEDGDL